MIDNDNQRLTYMSRLASRTYRESYYTTYHSNTKSPAQMAVYISSKRKKRLLLELSSENEHVNTNIKKMAKVLSPSLPSQLASPPPSSPLQTISDSELNKEKPTISSKISTKPLQSIQKNTIMSMFSAKLKNSSVKRRDHTVASPTSSPPHINTKQNPQLTPEAALQIGPKFTLKSIESSPQDTSLHTPPSPSLRPFRPRSLVQAQLSVGVDSQKTCSLCGMSYTPVLKSDVRSHERFHNQLLEGRPWPESYGKRITNQPVINSSSEYIVKVDATSKSTEKAAVQDILDIVNSELNAPAENPFWRTRPDKGAAFIYIKNKKATSLLIVERINQAHAMDASTGQLTELTLPAVMGVSRIFTARNSRSLHMASSLLNASLSSFIYGISIPKSRVAWSQPTASGLKLSLRWGQFDPTHKTVLVYLEDDI